MCNGLLIFEPKSVGLIYEIITDFGFVHPSVCFTQYVDQVDLEPSNIAQIHSEQNKNGLVKWPYPYTLGGK